MSLEMNRYEKIQLGKKKFKQLKRNKMSTWSSASKNHITNTVLGNRNSDMTGRNTSKLTSLHTNKSVNTTLKDIINGAKLKDTLTIPRKTVEANQALKELEEILNNSLKLSSFSSSVTASEDDLFSNQRKENDHQRLFIIELQKKIERQEKEIQLYKKVIQGMDELCSLDFDPSWAVDVDQLNRVWSRQNQLNKKKIDHEKRAIGKEDIDQWQSVGVQTMETSFLTMEQNSTSLASQSIPKTDYGTNTTKEKTYSTKIQTSPIERSEKAQQTIDNAQKEGNLTSFSSASSSSLTNSFPTNNLKNRSSFSRQSASLSTSLLSLAQKRSSSTQTEFDRYFLSMSTIKSLFKLQQSIHIPIDSIAELLRVFDKYEQLPLSEFDKENSVESTQSNHENLWSLYRMNEKLQRNIRTLSDQLAFQIQANAEIKKWVIELAYHQNASSEKAIDQVSLRMDDKTQELVLLYQDALFRVQNLEDECAYWTSLCMERQEFIEQTLLAGFYYHKKYGSIKGDKDADENGYCDLVDLPCLNCSYSKVVLEL